MSQHYSDQTRASDPYALPNVEIFHIPVIDGVCNFDWLDESGEPYETGWYFWFSFPGCLPDSDPMGPYLSEQLAIDAAGEE